MPAIALVVLGMAPLVSAVRAPGEGWGVAWLADALWLRLSLCWEARDAAGVRRWLPAVLAAAPAESRFRVDAARMLAHDLPAWREAAEPGAPRAVVVAWRRAAASEALGLLAAGDPSDARRWVEAGILELRALGDPASAAWCFRRAAASPGGPEYAARLHVRLSFALGRGPEAARWLRGWAAARPLEQAAAARAAAETLLAELGVARAEGPEPL